MCIYVCLCLYEGIDCRIATKVLQRARSSKRSYWKRGRQLIQMCRVSTRTDIHDWTRRQICWRQIELHRVANSMNCKVALDPRSSRSQRCMTAEMGIDITGESKARYGWTVRRMNYWLIQMRYISSRDWAEWRPMHEASGVLGLSVSCHTQQMARWHVNGSVPNVRFHPLYGFPVRFLFLLSFWCLISSEDCFIFQGSHNAHMFICSPSTVIFIK